MLNSARVVAMLSMVRLEVDAVIVRSSGDFESINQVSDVVSVPAAAAGSFEFPAVAVLGFLSL